MIFLLNWFVKLTGFLPQLFVFRTKVHYEDRKVQGRLIHGPAIIISNHTSVYDYAAFLFVFWSRTLRYQMAEVLFQKKLLGLFLKAMGGIKVDRGSYNFSFVQQSLKILEKKGVVGVFPESRLPLPGEERPLPFKESATYLALESGVPVIPVYTNGCYFTRARAEVVIGCPLDVREFWDDKLDEKSNIAHVTEIIRNKVIELGKTLENEA